MLALTAQRRARCGNRVKSNSRAMVTQSVILGLLWLLSAPATSETLRLQPYSAKYSVEYNGFKVGEVEQRLRQLPDNHYRFETRSYATGFIALLKRDVLVEQSLWRQIAGNPEPIRYHSHYSGRKNDVTEQVTFDWSKRQASSLRDGVTKTLPIEAGMMDKLMQQVWLRQAIADGKKRITYQIVDRHDIRDYHYQVIGDEVIKTALGKLDTVKVKKGTSTFWLAKDHDYLLVKLVQQNDSETITTHIMK